MHMLSKLITQIVTDVKLCDFQANKNRSVTQ